MTQPTVCPGCRATLTREIALEVSGALRCPRCRTRLAFSLDETTRTPVTDLEDPATSDTRRGLLGPMLITLVVLIVLSLAQETITMPRRERVSRPIAPKVALVVNPPTPVTVAPARVATNRSIEALDDEVALGEMLFHREWVEGAPLVAGGDGLGPLFNERSCVACHSLGGSGGAGAFAQNVDIVSSLRRPDTNLKQFHPGFQTTTSLVIHRFGTDPGYAAWRSRLLGDGSRLAFRGISSEEEREYALNSATMPDRDSIREALSSAFRDAMRPPERFRLSINRSQRNPSPLFGSGRIDAIPEAVLEGLAGRKFADFPEVRGRLARTADGKVGSFGWKAQASTLEEFVLRACSIELGLEVPGHHQAAQPNKRNPPSAGLDINERQSGAMVKYVRSLPAPGEIRPTRPAEIADIKKGRQLFESIGCATCHTSDVGEVTGIYSDLLLHDMGPDLADSGSYYGTPSPRTGGGSGVADSRPADPAEWRTPPLWGFADSAPYLHDGRANSLTQVVAMHGGEADKSSTRFFQLARPDCDLIRAFLESLVAPTRLAPAR